MSVVLAGETFALEDFRGLGHSETLDASGTRPAEPRFPDRIFARLLEEIEAAKEDLASGMVSTSASSVEIGVDDPATFVIADVLPIFAGIRGMAVDAANVNNYVFFQITTWTEGTKTAVVNVTNTGGSGTITDWNLVFGVGDTGPEGTPPDADTSTKGLVELATDAETITGTDTNRAVTAAGLKARLDVVKTWQKLIYIETVEEGDYVALPSLPVDIDFNTIRSVCVSGSCTATVKINTTALGGTANSVSSTGQNQAHASANAAIAGNSVNVTISGNSSCIGLLLYYEGTVALS